MGLSPGLTMTIPEGQTNENQERGACRERFSATEKKEEKEKTKEERPKGRGRSTPKGEHSGPHPKGALAYITIVGLILEIYLFSKLPCRICCHLFVPIILSFWYSFCFFCFNFFFIFCNKYII